MRRKPSNITPEQEEFIRSLIGMHSMNEITSLINEKFKTEYSFNQIRGFFKRNNLSNNLSKEARSRVSTKGGIAYTEDIYHFISSIAPGKSRKEITDKINIELGTKYTVEQVVCFMKNYGITNGLDGRIPKGGDWRTELAKTAPHPSNKGQFEKGNKPKNQMDVGTERDLEGYLYVKIQENPLAKLNENWRPKHWLIWEKYHGPVPKGGRVIFLDGNKRNFNIDNLALVTNAELGIMNKRDLFSNNPELTSAGLNLAKVYAAINKRKRR